MLKQISSLTLVVGLALGLTACNERDVAIGAGAVGGAIVVGSIYDNYYGRDYRHSRGHYRNGSSYWDRHDGRYYRHGKRWYRDGRHHGRNDHRRGKRWNFSELQANTGSGEFEIAALSKSATASSREGAVAAKYLISKSAARQVGDAFSSVERYGKLEGFRAMGLTDNDMARITNGNDAGPTSIARIAKTIGANTSSVQGLLRDVRDEYSLYSQGKVETTN